MICLFQMNYGQRVINGSFECNSAITCQWNLSNAAFNGFISNVTGFGAAQELDYHENACGYSTAPDGNWFVSLHTVFPDTSDALSLDITPNLTAGNTYTLTYWDQSNTTNDPLDSLVIGLSTTPLSLGTPINTSQPVVGSWTQRTVTFVAPFAAGYITVSNQGAQRGWNFVDDFRLLFSAVSNDSMLFSNFV